ncbi:MAG: hypothetical protein R2861_10610 [Desulfobacterales bacterium]
MARPEETQSDCRVISAAMLVTLKTSMITVSAGSLLPVRVIPLEVPALQERKEDVLSLAEYFAKKYFARPMNFPK